MGAQAQQTNIHQDEYLKLPSAASWLRTWCGMGETEINTRKLKKLVEAGRIAGYWRAGSLVVGVEDLKAFHRSIIANSKEESLVRFNPKEVE